MIAARIVAALFGLPAIYNLWKGDYRNAAAGFFIVAVLLALDVTVRRTHAQNRELLAWLREHEHEIRSGGARLDHVMVTPRTRVRQMSLCVSVLLTTFRVASTPLIEDRDSVVGPAFGWSVLTLLLGWWALPWGPIFTLKALGRNLRGGRAYEVEELLEKMRSSTSTLTGQ